MVSGFLRKAALISASWSGFAIILTSDTLPADELERIAGSMILQPADPAAFH